MPRLVSVLTLTIFLGLSNAGAEESRILQYSTYLGATYGEGNYSLAIAVDDTGCVYLTGNTNSLTGFPTVSAYQSRGWGSLPETFVTKFDPSGSMLVYSTYLGGITSYGAGRALAVDGEGKTWVAGWSHSPDFPTVNAYQASNAGYDDIYLSRLSSAGSTLEYSTYLGGSGRDGVYSLGLDESENVYLVGITASPDFPTVNAYQASNASSSGNVNDAFIAVFSSSGTGLIYSTYLGGDSYDTGYALAVEPAGEVIVGGDTASSDFPTRNAYQTSNAGGRDAFLCRFSSAGSSLEFSTYLGGSQEDGGAGLTVQKGGITRIVFTGRTASDNFPTRDAYQSTRAYTGGNDAFVSLFFSGGTLVTSTYLGGAGGPSQGDDVALDLNSRVWLTGSTSSPYFPTVNPYQARIAGGSDAFLSCLSPGATELYYSTFLGGASADEGMCLATGSGAVYLGGFTVSIGFPTKNAYQSSLAGGNTLYSDVFLSKFSPPPAWNYDYNGDGTSEIAVFRDYSGLWAIRGLTRVYYGQTGDQPAPADYDGDGITDIAVFRPSSGLWALRGISRVYFGSSDDESLPGDYDGDGTGEPGIFRETTGLWAIHGFTRVYFGEFGDSLIPGYYSGGGRKEIAVFRGSSGLWAVRNFSRFYYGAYPDEPLPGNYGGGIWAGAVFRPSTGLWAVRGITRIYYGQSLDGGFPADYRGDGNDEIAIFRPSSGLWAVRNLTRIYFGQYGDIPVSR